MPKHALSFKHLIATSSKQQQQHRPAPERSVNDLLSSSRRAQPQQQEEQADAAGRQLPPHLRGQRVWAPSAVDPALEIDSGAVHPGELLRRAEQAHRAAARSVAGPAPPPSWRPSTAKPSDAGPPAPPEKRATTYDLLSAASVLGENAASPWPLKGAPRLVDCCVGLVLKLLHSTEVIADDEGAEEMTLGDAVLETTRELDLRLRYLVIRRAALLPHGDPQRLSDRQIRGLLEYDAGARTAVQHVVEDDDDWDALGDTDALPHLALTSHPSPIPLLRDVPRMQALALTSLDLAYCTLPADLDRLVAVLPSGLRTLGLRGVRAPKPSDVTNLWVHGMNSLGRKLIVLRTLDLSEFPATSAPLLTLLKALLQPVGTHLPSLRVLGLTGVLDQDESNATRMVTKRAVSEILRSDGERTHWVEVLWE